MVVDEDMKKYVVVDPMKKLIKKEGNCVVWLSWKKMKCDRKGDKYGHNYKMMKDKKY